jgi:hypothetical protein
MSLLLFGTGGRVAIAFGTLGTKAITGTTAVSIAYPASSAAGDLLIATRVVWLAVNSSASDEPGWVSAVDQIGGTGAAADIHDNRVHVDYKEAAGGEAGSVVFDQTVNANGVVGIMCRFTKGAGTVWDVAVASGTDDTHAANRSVTSTGTVSLAAGDMVVALVASDTDASLTITSPAITASGITFGTTNRQTSGLGSVQGNDGNVELFHALVTAGSGTQALSLNFTTATSQCGPVAFLRLREATPATAPPTYQPVRRMQPYLVR